MEQEGGMIWEPMWMVVCFETCRDYSTYSILKDHYRPAMCYMKKEDAEKHIMDLKAKNPNREFFLFEATHCTEMRDDVVFLERIGE